ncbi:MAG: SH3 domain-containing protein [Clostridia bacterium]|nr:SH3 domain-containing protein [Clostridia bacterium]
MYGTEFYQRKVSYKTSDGNTINTDKTYADLIWESAIYSGVSPYHLASRIRQELGSFLSNPSISGTVDEYEGLYNFYNIGATSSTEYLGAVKNGLKFAKDGKGASLTERENLFLPWNTPERAIKGGAVFIGSSYISVGQNTLYLQKFSVNTNYPNKLYWHQYMTNCLAPYNESARMYNAYKDNGMLDSSIGFLIPVYENMPEIMKESPKIDDSLFIDDIKSMYANVTTTLNVRSGPGTDYEILTSIPSKTVVTRLKKGTQEGETWDKIKLENGAVGYVFATYLAEVIQPQWELSFDSSLHVEGNKISGLPWETSTVSNITSLVSTNLQISFENTNQNRIGTGSKLILSNASGNKVHKYEFVLYGDLDGDGLINSKDLLILQKHILEIKPLEGIYYKAGNLSKNGNPPSSLDMLKLQKHILEINYIEQ